MNQGVLQSSPVQQMMAGNPDWWSINVMRPPPTHHQQPPSPFFPFPPPPPQSTFFPHFIPASWHDNNNQELPESWSQLLLGEEERGSIAALHQANSIVDTKQENPASSYVYVHATEDFHHHEATKAAPNWSTTHQITAAAANSSSKSCVTSLSNNMLEFSGNKGDVRQPPLDRYSECNSSSTATGGGALKKTKVQPCVTQSTFKLLNENYTRKRKGGPDQKDSNEEPKKELKSRGLCLVPVSCTLQVWSDNGADFGPTKGFLRKG